MTSRSLILLTFNEVGGTRALLPRLPLGTDIEVLAVDGGSSDGTRELLAEHGIRVVDQERRGRGEAMRVGMRACAGDHVVFFSPDGNEDPADIPRLFDALERGADLVIASRFLPGARNEEDDAAIPARKWVNQAFTLAANVIWNRGPRVTDTINGFRGIRRDVFLRLDTRSMGYTIEYEMTIRAMKGRLRIEEVPTVESERLAGETKAPSFKTGVAFLRYLASEIARG